MSQKSADFLESGDNTRFSESPSAAAASDAHSRFHDLVFRVPPSVERTSSSQVQAIPNAVPGDSGVQMLPNAVPGDVQAQNLVYYPQGGGDAYSYAGAMPGEGHHGGGHCHGHHGGGRDGAVGNASYDTTSGQGVVYDANGNPIQVTAVDANGNPVPVTPVGANGPMQTGAMDGSGNGVLPNGATDCGWNNIYKNGGIVPGQGAFDNTQTSYPAGSATTQFDANGNLIPASASGGAFDGSGNFIPATQAQGDNPMSNLPTTGPGGVVDGGHFIPSVPQGDGSGSFVPNQAAGGQPFDGNAINPTAPGTAPTDNTGANTKVSQQDLQTMLQSWAAVNGADLSNQNSYTQLGKSMSDGQSTAIGPFQLDGKAIQSWMSSLQGQNGQLDTNAVSQLVQSGEISQQTAQVLTSPDFAQFVQGLAQGQQPTPDQVAKLFPPELQNAIASDTLQASALSMQQQGGFDPGMVVLGAELGRQLTSQDMTNPQIQQVVNAIDQVWSKNQVAPTPQPGADQTAGVPQQPGQQQGSTAGSGAADWMPPDVAPNTSSVPSAATAPDTSGGDYSQYTDNSGGN